MINKFGYIGQLICACGGTYDYYDGALDYLCNKCKQDINDKV